jgi:hypothetical protein
MGITAGLLSWSSLCGRRGAGRLALTFDGLRRQMRPRELEKTRVRKQNESMIFVLIPACLCSWIIHGFKPKDDTSDFIPLLYPHSLISSFFCRMVKIIIEN